MSLIACKNLSMGYDGKTVIDNISFEVNSGDYLCIVGENGSGKSTLMKGLLGLKNPIKGEIQFGEGLVSTEIGYLPQQSDIQKQFPARVSEVVLSGRLNKRGLSPFYTQKDKEDAKEKMEILGITDIKNRSFQELSGGQQQRVLLARALLATKRILLLDEPTAGLDPVVTQDFYKILDEINKKYNITIIMISHDIMSGCNNATHILHLGENTVFFGNREEYLNQEIGKRFFGGVSHV